MARTLIHNGYIVTVNPNRDVWPDGYVAIDGTDIIDLGPAGSAPLPGGADRYVWIAAEKDLVRKAKARFRDTLGIGPKESYFAYYWEACWCPPEAGSVS